MLNVCLGVLGFISYYLYDLNSVTINNKVIHMFFALGTLLVTASCVLTCWGNFRFSSIALPMIFIALFFLALLIYTLFFAIPFTETYINDNSQRKAFTGGIYALCRHPGVLWFAGLYMSLWAIFPSASGRFYFPLMIVLNIFYIVLQDLYSFPKTFINYADYQKVSPFLIPTRQSIQRCVNYFKHRGHL